MTCDSNSKLHIYLKARHYVFLLLGVRFLAANLTSAATTRLTKECLHTLKINSFHTTSGKMFVSWLFHNSFQVYFIPWYSFRNLCSNNLALRDLPKPISPGQTLCSIIRSSYCQFMNKSLGNCWKLNSGRRSRRKPLISNHHHEAMQVILCRGLLIYPRAETDIDPLHPAIEYFAHLLTPLFDNFSVPRQHQYNLIQVKISLPSSYESRAT